MLNQLTTCLRQLPASEENPETTNINVTVTESTTKLSGVTVKIGDISGTTGSAGGCTLNNVPIGKATVTATKSGYTTYSKSVTITSETKSLTISMTKNS